VIVRRANGNVIMQGGRMTTLTMQDENRPDVTKRAYRIATPSFSLRAQSATIQPKRQEAATKMTFYYATDSLSRDMRFP